MAMPRCRRRERVWQSPGAAGAPIRHGASVSTLARCTWCSPGRWRESACSPVLWPLVYGSRLAVLSECLAEISAWIRRSRPRGSSTGKTHEPSLILLRDDGVLDAYIAA